MKNLYMLICALLLCVGAQAKAPCVERAEPLSWWTGMNLPLQIMFHGEGIGACDVKVVGEGLKITAVHRADSPNYLLVDVNVVAAGNHVFEFTNGRRKAKHTYRIDERREGSARRTGFTSADMIYLLMPDRFANGDPSNDSNPALADKLDRNDHFGRHGGDIQGIIDHLDYLHDLGVTALWCTPMLLDNDPGGSYHGYAAADYYQIDPRFGSNELYRTLVQKSREKGIKTIMDIVPNHCGLPHYWMGDLPFAEWINFSSGGGMVEGNHLTTLPADPYASQYDTRKFNRGWFWRGMPDINLTNPYVLQYFKQWVIWWIEWADLDGLRVDTFTYSEKHAVADWCKAIRDEYPNLSVVGETWFATSPDMVAYWSDGLPNSDGYDSHLPMVMDFPLMRSITEGLNEAQGWEKGTMRIYNSITHDFLYGDPHKLLIFLENHDTERIADIFEGDAARVKMAVTLLCTMRGIPQLYYGAELMFRSAERTVKDGPQRIDFPGGWAGDGINLFKPENRTAEQQDLFEYVRRLMNWRKTAQVIHSGKTMHFHNYDNSYVFFRYNEQQVVMVAVNNADTPKEIAWDTMDEITRGLSSGKDILTGRQVTVGEQYSVPGRTSAVVVFMK